MPALYLEIHPDNPDQRKINQVVKILQDGGIIIYPTDTIYGLGCDITNNRAVERICQLKGIKPEKANFSFICADLSRISDYAAPFSTSIYKVLKRHLPGAFTFILKASNGLPKMMKNNKKTVGIRVPNSPIVRVLVEGLGNPLMSTSIKNTGDEILEYPTDPYEIWEEYQHLVDVVIDGGAGSNVASTIVDCTTDEPVVTRQGAGEFDLE